MRYVRDVFDFVFTFAGVSTLPSLVVPALTRFVENVFIYDMRIWEALQQSFGEDRHALNSAPVMLSFAEIDRGPNNTSSRVVDTRVLAYSNLKDGRPWGLDIYRCPSCGGPAYNMIFHPDGHHYLGNKWIDTKFKYKCMKCGAIGRKISSPSWIYAAGSQNYGRVWYKWPLTHSQLREIGHK